MSPVNSHGLSLSYAGQGTEIGCGAQASGRRLVHVVPTSLLHEKFGGTLGDGALLDLRAHQFSVELRADVRYCRRCFRY